MKRNILIFGSIAGAIIATFMGTSMVLSKNYSEKSMLTSMLVGLGSMILVFSIFIFVAVKNYRDKQNGGVIKFGQAFLMGIMISLIASTIYVAMWAVEYHYFMPEWSDKFVAGQVKMIEADASIPQVEKEIAIKELNESMTKYKTNILYFIMTTYTEILPMGILVTLICSVVLKRKIPKPVTA